MRKRTDVVQVRFSFGSAGRNDFDGIISLGWLMHERLNSQPAQGRIVFDGREELENSREMHRELYAASRH
jgi:hypothetical protein